VAEFWLLERHRDDTLANCIGNAVPDPVWLRCPVFEGFRPAGSEAMIPAIKRRRLDSEHLQRSSDWQMHCSTRWMISSFSDAGSLMFGRKDGLVGFVLAAVRKDIRNGVTMLGMITPKQLEATVNKTEVKYQTIAEVDADLARLGLPPTREIFQIDFVGTPVAEEAVGEAEPEILSTDRDPTK
jgi:hypothetical protein